MIIAGHWNDGPGPGPWFLLWFLAILIFWGAVIFTLSRVWRRGWWGPRRPEDMREGRTAQDLLAERYARGEITEDEYRERRAVLREEAQ